MARMTTLQGPLIFLSLLMMAACDGAIEHRADPSRCESLDFRSALAGDIDEIQVWAGNQAGFAPQPLLTHTDREKIASITGFFLERSDLWYIAAGETYDPASRRSGSEFTIRFFSGGSQRAYIGWGHTYLETPGCGFEVVRPLSPPDRPELMHLIFDTPHRR